MRPMTITTDFLIIGGGIAGLSAAIEAGHKGKVILLTKGKTGESATEYAQGGIAAAIDEEKDSPLYHLEDTLEAGAGLCDEKAVEILVKEGVKRVHELIEMGARFDKIGESYELTLEGAHRHRRILHAGDATGAEIERALAARLLKENLVDVRNFIYGKDLIIKDGICLGATAIDVRQQKELQFLSYATTLATGGLGQVYLHNTNPRFATGDGVAMAYRAGGDVTDMEFVQFHPTTLLERPAPEEKPLFLISEAVRGEGAILLNTKGERFMPRYHDLAELAPRDIVARAIVSEMQKTASDHVYLRASIIGAEKIKKRFPTIYEECLKRGFDITKDDIPVSPAAHYAMGGVKTNLNGQTKIAGLYAAGEVASVGVHGANRLASNSLLDGLVFGHRAALAAAEYISTLKKKKPEFLTFKIESQSLKSNLSDAACQKLKLEIKKFMWEDAGIIRSGEGLLRALKKLKEIEKNLDFIPQTGQELELKNMTLVAYLIARAALDRHESRGAHFRTDFPNQDDVHWKKHLVYSKSES